MDTMHTEHQQIEIKSALGSSKLTLRRSGDDVIGVRVSTPDYNVSTVIKIPDFLLAARTLCEPEGRGETPSSPSGSTPTTRALDLIAAERDRQNGLVDAGKIPWNCAHPMVALKDKAFVWTEEAMEVSREFCAFASATLAIERHEAKQRLRTELIQLAAVSVAILESMEAQP